MPRLKVVKAEICYFFNASKTTADFYYLNWQCFERFSGVLTVLLLKIFSLQLLVVVENFVLIDAQGFQID